MRVVTRRIVPFLRLAFRPDAVHVYIIRILRCIRLMPVQHCYEDENLPVAVTTGCRYVLLNHEKQMETMHTAPDIAGGE